MGAIIGASVIGAGATLTAAALAGGPAPGETRISAPGSDINPALKVAEFNNLLAQGIFDPTPLRQASPLNQLLSEVLSTAALTEQQKKGKR